MKNKIRIGVLYPELVSGSLTLGNISFIPIINKGDTETNPPVGGLVQY